MYTRVREGGGCRERTWRGWPWLGGQCIRGWFWRERLGRARLSGMYPSLLHNRGFDACSTSSLRLVLPFQSAFQVIAFFHARLANQADELARVP